MYLLLLWPGCVFESEEGERALFGRFGRRHFKLHFISLCVASPSCHACCSQVLACTSSWCLAASAQLWENVQRNHYADVNQAHDHNGGRPKLPAGSIFWKECKLVSLTLGIALLAWQPAGPVWLLGARKGSLASSLLLWLVHGSNPSVPSTLF